MASRTTRPWNLEQGVVSRDTDLIRDAVGRYRDRDVDCGYSNDGSSERRNLPENASRREKVRDRSGRVRMETPGYGKKKAEEVMLTQDKIALVLVLLIL